MSKSKLSVFNFRRPDGKKNFGDNISPNLIARVANCETVWARNTQADVVAMGSIIQSFNNRKKSWQTRANRFFKTRQIVWGSGLIQPQESYIGHTVVCALRGPLTAESLGLADRKLPYGDPGILFSKYFKAERKNFDVGVVLHYLHLEKWKTILKNYNNIKVISAEDEPETVLTSISQCRRIMSSSLHGLIAADSYNIPNISLEFDTPLKGGNFKFADYALGVERERHVFKIIRNLKDFDDALESLDTYATLPHPDKIRTAANNLEEALLTRLEQQK